MAAWDVSIAIGSLRSLLGDNGTDKFTFKADVFPTPDLVTTRFFAGHTRLVPNSLLVYLNGVQVAPSGTPDWTAGTFNIIPAPSGSLQASFYHRWFSDSELMAFLNDAADMMNFADGFLSANIETGLRPSLLQFACYNAYMRKAAEWAESLEAQAAGYTLSTKDRGPNWKALAELAWKNANDKLKLYIENPLSKNRLQMATITYRLQNYVPR